MALYEKHLPTAGENQGVAKKMKLGTYLKQRPRIARAQPGQPGVGFLTHGVKQTNLLDHGFWPYRNKRNHKHRQMQLRVHQVPTFFDSHLGFSHRDPNPMAVQNAEAAVAFVQGPLQQLERRIPQLLSSYMLRETSRLQYVCPQ